VSSLLVWWAALGSARFVLAAYGVTLLTLFGYGWWIAAGSRALREEISRARPNGG
jgi:hypothetical protein